MIGTIAKVLVALVAMIVIVRIGLVFLRAVRAAAARTTSARRTAQGQDHVPLFDLRHRGEDDGLQRRGARSTTALPGGHGSRCPHRVTRATPAHSVHFGNRVIHRLWGKLWGITRL